MIELVWPWLLWLLPLPALVWLWLPAARSEQAAVRAPFFSNWQQLQSDTSTQRGRTALLPWILLLLIWVSLLTAATRPTWIGEPITLPTDARDLLLAVDISGSMQIEDMQVGRDSVTRILAVKSVVSEFIERRQGDRIGLILFGSQAYLQSPLTFDSATVERFLLEAQLGFAGKETAIGDAIGLSVKRLRDRPAASRVVILLTDGANTSGLVEPLDAARLAAQNEVKIYTVGVGADEMTVPGLFGSSFGSRTVNPSADLDESALQSIAQQTGGQYFRARNPEELAEIYRLLDQLEPVDQDASTYRPRSSLFHWPLALAMLSSLMLALIRVQWSLLTRTGSRS